MDDQILFGRKIRAVRKRTKLSREKIAERAEISSNYLGEIERGEKWPSLPIIGSIARALSVSPAVFFDFESQDSSINAFEQKLRHLLKNRGLEEIQKAYRVLKALLEP